VENLRDRSAKKVYTFLANYSVFMRDLGLTGAVVGASSSKAPRPRHGPLADKDLILVRFSEFHNILATLTFYTIYSSRVSRNIYNEWILLR
jgi:hypothetical protein